MGFLKKRIEREIKAAQGDWFVAFQDAIEANRSHAGVSVTQENATNLAAVYRCVSLNTDVVSTLPVDFKVKKDGKRESYPEPGWYTNPNDAQDWGGFLAQVEASLELDGNAFIMKVSTSGGLLVGLHLLNPTAVQVDRPTDTGQRIYKVAVAGGVKFIPQSGVVHVQGFTLPGAIRGMSPIMALKQSIGLGLAVEQYGAQFFGTGATLSGVIEMPGGGPEGDALETFKDNFKRKHGGISKSHAVGILTGGAKWQPLSVNPEESQFLETRRFTDVQIACAFGVPAEYVTETEGVKGYVTGLYARQYMWMQTGINPRLVRLERAFSALLPDKNAYMKFNRNAFLAMDPAERGSFYSKGLQGRWLTPNQIAAKEDMDGYPGGDEYLWSVQWTQPGQEKPTNNLPA